MPTLISVFYASLVAVGILLLKRLFRRKYSAPLPPGPKGWPWIGNIFNMPSQADWQSFSKWTETWGDMCFVTVLGQPIIIVNSYQVAVEMLDKKSSIYSDRPVLQVGGELVGYKNTTGLLPYGGRHRVQRALFHRFFGTNAAMRAVNPTEELETHRLLKRILRTPDEFPDHVRKTTGAIILQMSHGYEVKEGKDPFVEMADKVLDNVSEATAPGSFVADVFPIFRHLPDWLPGAGFKRKAKVWRKAMVELVDQPHNFVKQQMSAGAARRSFTSVLLEEKEVSPEEEYEIKWTAVSIFAGGADTTVGAIMAFFLAMTIFPEVAQKAQAEIDAVIGGNRLPKISDREQLPYTHALTLEVLRWHSVVPAALPHRVSEDDIHAGYYIPKGTLVLPNIWKMCHDPELYADPMSFDPSRYIASEGKKAEMDPREMCFGHGRRICPGKLVADSSLFITCAMTLAVFDIGKRVKDGVVDQPHLKPTPGSISHPSPFESTITPRSAKAIALIQADEGI